MNAYDHRHSPNRRALALLIALAVGGMAQAQDSGLGVDLQFGGSLDPRGTGEGPPQCDSRGASWLDAYRKHTPTGFIYACPPAPEEQPDQAYDAWQFLASIGFGYLYLGGDQDNAAWQRYQGLDDGALFEGNFVMQRPADGSYVNVRGSRASADNQFYRLVAGRAGEYRIQAFVRSQDNVLSSTAKPLWGNLGSQNLTLLPGLVPGGSTPADVTAFMAATPEQVVSVRRDKQGFGLNYYFTRSWTGFFNVSHEKREGSRPFGGPFFFGRLVEVLRPIDDSTVNLNGGLRYAGPVWRTEFTYSGSFFRNGMDHFTYQMPLATGNNNPVGLFSYEPQNDYHRLGATLTRKLASAWNGELSITAALTEMRQNEPLVPGLLACNGMLNATINCDDWNRPAALSQRTADVGIDNQRLGAKLVLHPGSDLTWRSGFNFLREDYRGTYIAFNPLTGQYGYIAENGGFPNTTWLPGASNLVHVKNLPLDKETWDFSTGLDWRIDQRNTLGATYEFKRIDRSHREVAETSDNSLKFSWINRSTDWLTLRLNYTFLDRSGGSYNPDPYEFLYTRDLPGFVVPPNGLAPHTVDDMRKYDLSDRTQHKIDVMASFTLSPTTNLYTSLRAERNSYDALIGRRAYDTLAGTVQFEWQPDAVTTLNAWYGLDRSSLDLNQVNDIPTGRGSAALGGPTYPLDYRWWMTDSQRNHNAGLGLHRQFERVSFDLDWNYIYTQGTTRWSAISAIANPAAATAGLDGRFPHMTWRINSVRAQMSVPFTERFGLRAFATYEKGRAFDWHYAGFEEQRNVGNMIYTDGGPADYSASLVGVLLELKL